MDEIARLGVEIDATSADKAKTSLDSLTAAGGRAEAATSKLGKATGATAAELDAFQKKAVAAAVAQTGMTEAQAAAALGFRAAATEAEAVVAAHGKIGLSALQVREPLVLLREFMRGNYTRMAGSASILLGSFGLITAEGLIMAAGIAAAAAPFAILALAFVKGQEEASKLNNILAVTNGYSGLTASGFEDMAARISKASDTGIGKTKANIEAMIASGKFTGDTIDQLVSYSAKLAQLTGQDSGKIVASFDAMKGSVVQFAAKHEETYHDLTLDQVDYIAELEKAGKHHEAELAFATDINAKVQTLTVQYGLLQNIMHGVGDAASSLWDNILGVGRPDTTLEKLNKAVADLKAKSDDMVSGQGSYGATVDGYTNSPSDVGAQAAVVRQLTAQLRKEQADAAAKAKAAQDQDDAIQKKYGPKGAHTPTDTTGQRSAQVDAAIAQAQGAELQAQLGLTTDIMQRAGIEKQIAQAARDQKQAQTERQIAEIQNDKGLDAATRAELTAKLKGVEGAEAAAAALKQRLADEQAHDALIKQALSIANAERDAQATVLEAQQGITTDIAARAAIETKLLALADQKAIADAQAVIDSQGSSAAQKKIAQLQIDAVNGAHGYKQQAIDQQAMADAVHQQAGIAQDELSNQIGVLASQEALAQYATQRLPIDQKIFDLQQQIAQSKALEAVWAAAAAGDQVALAKALADLKTLTLERANELTARKATLLGSFDDLNGSLSSMASAFGQQDWAGVLRNLNSSIAGLEKAFDPVTGTLAGKIGAVAGVGKVIGGAVGGQAGSTIGGLASGAMIGMTLGGPIGAALGAIGGGIAGFLGGGGPSAAQRRSQEDQAAAQAAQALQTAQMTRQQQAQQQELALITLTGDQVKITAYQRQQELAGLDATNQARQQEIYALTDQLDALQKVVDARTADVAGAQQALSSAYQAQVQQLTAVADAAKSASASLGSFLGSLTNGADAMNSPLRQYMLSKTALVGINGRVASGDASAHGDVQNSVTSFLQAAQARAPSRQAYGQDLAFAQKSISDAKASADAQVSVASQQLDTLNQQVSGLMVVNQSVLTVAAAVANLHAAMDAQTTAQQALQQAKDQAAATVSSKPVLTTFTTPDYVYYVDHNPDLKAQFLAQTGYAKGRNEAAYGLQMWTNFDNSARQFTPFGQMFAMGGAFTGPVTDIMSRPTQLNVGGAGEAGPEAIMPLRRGSDGRLGVAANDENAKAIAALADRMDRLATAIESGNRYAEKTAKILTRVTQDGNSLQTTAAA